VRRLLAVSLFLLLTLSAGIVFSGASTQFCSASVGETDVCTNTLEVQDEATYFTHTLRETFYVPDPYHITFKTTRFQPNVVRGDPVYGNYWIMDNLNSEQIYLTSAYNGKHLLDYGATGITFNPNVTGGYYPKSYGSPTTTLVVRNAAPVACLPPVGYVLCQSYYQASQFSVD